MNTPTSLTLKLGQKRGQVHRGPESNILPRPIFGGQVTQMLEIVQERAIKAGISSNIRVHLCEANRIGITDELDFVVAFFMVHEVPDSRAFLKELFALLKPGGQLFLAEPMIHVSRRDFERTVAEAQAIGFEVSKRPSVRIGRAVILIKPSMEE